jgi:prepilin-type processing-associated H-X9-DG protein
MGRGWAGQILPYTKSRNVYRCPDEPVRYPGASNPGAPYAFYSYRYNHNLVRDRGSTPGNTFAYQKKISSYTHPERSVLLYEAASDPYILTEGEDASPAGNGRRRLPTSPTSNDPALSSMVPGSGWIANVEPEPMSRHLGGSNILAADGHVKWFLPENISYGFTANSETAAELSSDPITSFTARAEGTEYAGADKHKMTMSYR